LGVHDRHKGLHEVLWLPFYNRNKIAILWQRKYQFPFHLYQKLSLTGTKGHDEQVADHDRFVTASLSSLDRSVDRIFLSGPMTESERR